MLSSKKSSSSNNKNNSKNKNLPTKALNLFDGLINLLIDGTEEVTAVPPSETSFHHSDASSSRKCSGNNSCVISESDFLQSPQKTRQNAGRESSITSDSNILGSLSSCMTSESDTVTSPQKNAPRQNPGSIYSCSSNILGSRHSDLTSESYILQSSRQNAGRESSSFTSKSSTLCSHRENFQESNTISNPTSQRVKLTTKRLAGGIEGCEVTVATKNDDGNPFIIRAVCPKFEPRRIWVNGKPFDYIDSESEHPIYDSSVEEKSHNNDDINEDEEEESDVEYDETSTLKYSN